MRAVLIVAIVFAAVHTAGAQPALTPPQPLVFDYLKPKPPEYKDPTTATALAIGGSAVGIAGVVLGAKMTDGGDTPIMMMGGLLAVFAPSAGNWWATGTARLTPGFGIRVAGAAIAGLGFVRAIDESCSDHTCKPPLENSQSNALILIGAATVVGGMVYDIATAGSAARNHNESLHLTPQVMSSVSGTSPGVGIAGRF